MLLALCQPIVLRVLGTTALIREIAVEVMGWKVREGPGKGWDVCWSPTNHLLRNSNLRCGRMSEEPAIMGSPQRKAERRHVVSLRLNGLQKLNHFPAMSDLARKDFLANNLNQ